jgi:outer membrane protein OmpA-like peptidoglycan-associated protein
MKNIVLSVILLMGLLGNVHSVNAQFWKKLGKRAENVAKEVVIQKVENKTAEKTGKVMDTILNTDKKIKRKKKRKNKNRKANKEAQQEGQNENIDKQNNAIRGAVRSAKDFVPGNKVVFSDRFLNDAIGDFPVTWNTNSSAEVVTFEGNETRWLQLSNKGQFTPDELTKIPKNSTFEFDLYVSDNYSYYSPGLWLNLVEVKNRKKDFTYWQRFKTGYNGIRLWLHPKDETDRRGRTGIYTYENGSKIIGNKKSNNVFTKNKNLIHVAIWRQESRIRVYIDNKKIWDLPRAFDNANYNAIVFGVDEGKDDAYFYVSNLRLAVAGEDLRKALLEIGKFETDEIHFNIGKASIQANSFSILDEIGQILQDTPELKLKIIGHTDSDGKVATNQQLSEARSKSVKEYLSNHFSIESNRLQTEGKGESNPVASNDTKDGKKKNRRVEFIKI